jgi:hypothetical protein
LLLSPGKKRRVLVALGRQPHAFEQGFGPFSGLGFAFAQDLGRRFDQVFQHRAMGQRLKFWNTMPRLERMRTSCLASDTNGAPGRVWFR